MSETQIPAGKSRIRAVTRFDIEPRDFDETAKFYRRLGFQVTIKGDAVGSRTAELKAGDVRIRFTEAPAAAHDRRRSAFHRLRLVLAIAKLEEMKADLRTKGVAFTEPPGGRGAEVVDPNGVRLLLEESA